jgi:hypothetical protein
MMKLLRMPAMSGTVVLVAAAIPAVAIAMPAAAADGYTFTRVADSVEDGLDANSFGCPTINARGDVAIRAGRLEADGFNTTPGIYRVSPDGTLSTVVESSKYQFIGFAPSINESGQISFAATLDNRNSTEVILRAGVKGSPKTIASTADEFNFFGFNTSLNDSGEVAFKAELDEEFGFVEGLFSGSGRDVTTHYRNDADVTLDGQPARFSGDDTRPSIDNAGEIVFEENLQPDFERGIFSGSNGTFSSVAAPDPDFFVFSATSNDTGGAAFLRTVVAENEVEVVKVTNGVTEVVADTRGEYSFFGTGRAPAINDAGDVAFLASLDSDFRDALYTGPDPATDRVIGPGETLDGATVSSVGFCEEGLSDDGELAFTAFFEDPETFELRAAVYRATPTP